MMMKPRYALDTLNSKLPIEEVVTWILPGETPYGVDLKKDDPRLTEIDGAKCFCFQLVNDLSDGSLPFDPYKAPLRDGLVIVTEDEYIARVEEYNQEQAQLIADLQKQVEVEAVLRKDTLSTGFNDGKLCGGDPVLFEMTYGFTP